MPKFLSTVWFWTTIFFVALIILGLGLFVVTSSGESFIAIIGSIVIGLFSFGAAVINFMGQTKKAAADNFEKINRIINDFREEAMDKNDKATEALNAKYNRLEATATELYVDSISKLEKNILEEVRSFKHEVGSSVKDLSAKVDGLSNNFNNLESGLRKIEESKDKKETWAKELEKDWEGSRSRIRMVGSKDLYNSALFIKESFKEYCMEILSWNLSTHSESDRDNLIERIVEKFDILMDGIYQHNICMTKEHTHSFKDLNRSNEVNFRLRITKSFKENIINNVYRNFFNYSSQYMNDVLNTYVQSYLVVHGIDPIEVINRTDSENHK